ncbi:Chlorophyllase-1 [Cocos nucifera]|uniref:Chlorophyllase-1 n=1 Tax=Cocos nucifera TaxID=13894 RepID=A0A8K0IKV7_COCNU|nr:Chlorophyllase-1 [Cocos nucifera]
MASVIINRPSATSASVFDYGTLGAGKKLVKQGDESRPPTDVLVVYPTVAGTYTVVLFLHGYFMRNTYYEQLLRHVASHGFILVAPQCNAMSPSSNEDIASAAAVTNWLSVGLQFVLSSTGVKPNLDKLALAGHSKGGHAAFSLALPGHAKTELKFSLLMGIDPVAGRSKSNQISPEILTYEPCSFKLEIPVLVIGTGLGSKKKNIIFPPCAAEGVNHVEFYNECKPPSYHFVVTDYGHLDMLDDTAPEFTKCLCKNGTNCREIMRRTTGGIMTAFLEAYLLGQKGDLNAIVADPETAPTSISVHYKLP